MRTKYIDTLIKLLLTNKAFTYLLTYLLHRRPRLNMMQCLKSSKYQPILEHCMTEITRQFAYNTMQQIPCILGYSCRNSVHSHSYNKNNCRSNHAVQNYRNNPKNRVLRAVLPDLLIFAKRINRGVPVFRFYFITFFAYPPQWQKKDIEVSFRRCCTC